MKIFSGSILSLDLWQSKAAIAVTEDQLFVSYDFDLFSQSNW